MKFTHQLPVEGSRSAAEAASISTCSVDDITDTDGNRDLAIVVIPPPADCNGGHGVLGDGAVGGDGDGAALVPTGSPPTVLSQSPPAIGGTNKLPIDQAVSHDVSIHTMPSDSFSAASDVTSGVETPKKRVAPQPPSSDSSSSQGLWQH